MERIIDFLKNTDFETLLISITSSGTLGAWLGYKAEKKKAEAELDLQKRNYEATIVQMEKEYELNIKQKQIEWEHEKQLLQGSLERDHIDRLQASYSEMIAAITEYINMSTPIAKSKAETEIRKFAVLASKSLYPIIDQLDDLVSNSDPFEGPEIEKVKRIIEQLRESAIS